ncbi:MAG: hypothetical protein KGI64_04235 [Xanthomonadaceae bacterium]|nr:hypothetical protein [Xanthomonadaceae bacterium]
MSKLALAFTFAIALVLACSAHANETYEPEPVLKAPLLVQAPLLSGPDFRVVPEVAVRGYMANFLIDTPFGPIHAASVEMLSIRIAELPAMEALDRASRSGAFATALTARAKKTGTAIVNVVTHPIDTITGLPEGVARYLSAQWDKWSGRARSLSDRSQREFENRGNPYRAPPGPMTALRDAPADGPQPPADLKNHAWYARAGDEVAREGKRYLQYNSQRRAMAKVLGVDPNSSNPVLNQELDTLAWAAVWGNFSAGTALGVVGPTAATVIGDTGNLNQYVLSKTPEQLRAINEKRLLALCSDQTAIRGFLHRGGFTDTLRTALVLELEKLAPKSGCDGLLELAAKTHGEVEARYLVNALKLIAQQPDRKAGELFTAGAAIAWRTPAGKLILPLPVDYLTWNADLAGFFDHPDLRAADKLVLIGGEASMLAQRALTARGWGIQLRAPYAGAPAYARFGEFAPNQDQAAAARR